MNAGSSLRRPASWLVAATLAFAIGCKRPPTRTLAQETGDAFVDHYLRADQEGALPYAELGAKSQLEKEISSVKDARDEGALDIHVTWKRTAEESRGQRQVLLYHVEAGEKSAARTMRLEVTDLGKGPKVVLYELQ